MESHSNLPPATGPNSQITNAAVNNDAQLNHPPYNEMITAAIVAMKERDGSSRQAIAKYIESEYKNLPPSHATLLTRQLMKMKNQGQSFVKGSVVTKRRPGRPPRIPSNGGGVGGVASPAVNCVSGLPVISDPSVMIGAVLMVVPMGESDGETPVKRHPGRPPKYNDGIVGVGIGEGGSVLGKRGRGCVVKEAGMMSPLVGNSDGVERGCGWPHKNVAVNSSGHSDGSAVFVPVEGMGSSGRASKIDVRRPKKQPRVKHVMDIARGALSGEGAAITGIIGAPSSDQGGPGSDPVESLCAQWRNLRI